MELWAAVSIGVVMIAVPLLTHSGAMRWWIAVAVGVLAYSILEAAFRRRLNVLFLRATLALAGLAVLTLADNVQEIRRS